MSGARMVRCLVEIKTFDDVKASDQPTRSPVRTRPQRSKNHKINRKINKQKKHLLAAAVAEQTSGEPQKDKHHQKFAKIKAEVMTPTKESLKEECFNYLILWKERRDSWNFKKSKQKHLVDYKFNKNMISETTWPLLLEYFGCGHPSFKKRLLKDANEIIRNMDEYEERVQASEEEATKTENKESKREENPLIPPDPLIYKRARDIIQNIRY